ncbi:outer membrane beta-barrel family protein [Paracrocinitomix mangrovi]|uniref:outer membrane beta-barrel family protein n=1 Tax=Paracrocinitomix mangrovi TaxID=2862509 RepID=UPI001C8D47DE|nr:outer membrane beta-barrel family protein [Paracrocinitomix mangrovi]UKN00967.1 outer membrane beta-barrel family protein [Paracrocinitomix mangrovi]
MKTLLLLFTLLLSTSLFSQTYKVKGYVSSDGLSVPSATVYIKSVADSSVAKVGLADTVGIFNITGIPNGEYFAEVSMVGLKRHLTEGFKVSDANVDLGEIEMSTNTELQTVEVVQLRPVIEIHPDKTVFNVDKTINATGENGFDLLRKAPGVIIDNSNNIMLEGKSGVMVFIDNKATVLAGDDLVNFLKTLQASDIDNIEIITQPSSKYDAAGNAGIINIILKKDKRLGTNGTIQGGYEYGVNHRYNGSINLNHRTKKTNLYGTYSTNQGKHRTFLFFDRTQNGFQYDSETYITSLLNSHNGKVGFDWFLNDKHTVGVLANGNFFNAGSESVATTDIGPSGVAPIQFLDANNITSGRNYQATGNINYRFADTLGHELTVDVDYGIYNREANSYQPNIYTDTAGNILTESNYRMLTPTNISILSGKADYSQNAWGGKLGFGAKFSMVKTANYFDIFYVEDNSDSLIENRSNDFFYDEIIGAAYLNYSRKLGKKLSMQLGLRYEHTIAKGDLVTATGTYNDTVNRNNPQLFPSGGLTWTPNMKHIWSLTFSRRITRPNYQTLNPFQTQLDELSYRQGNPTLKPSYANNARLSHTFKYRFNTSLSYSYVQNYFAQVTDTLGYAQNFISTKNVADEQTINLGVSLPFQIKKWWSLFFNLNAFHTSYIAKDEKFVPINRATANVFLSNTFLVKGGWKFELSGWYSSPSIWGGTYLVSSMGSLNIAVEKKFFKDRLSVRLAGNDILFTSYWRADLQYGDLYIDGSGGWESRKVAVNVIYNFGNKEVKKARQRKTSLEDVEERTGGGGGQGGQ